MDKLKVQVNGRGYFLKTDKPDEVLNFAKRFEEQINYLSVKMGNVSESEVTAYAALLLMGDSLSARRSEADQALVDELSGKAEVLEERIDTLSQQIAEHQAREEELVSVSDGLRAREQELSALVQDLSEKREQLAGAYNESENALNDTKSALASANKIIARLNTEKFTEVAANEALRNELEVSRDRLDAANKQIAELNGKITKMEINSIAVDSDGSVSVNEEAVKKLRAEKEDLEIELAIANEEIEKLKSANKAVQNENEAARKIAEYERTIKQLESRSTEIDKLRNVLAETEQAVRHKVDEKEEENDKLRNILKNYENSYGLSIARKEEEIIELQQQVERLKSILNMRSEEKLSGKYVQTTFDAESEAELHSAETPGAAARPDNSGSEDSGMSKL
ncbi:MAG: cell division protein ZapA [Ruminiclostridium sp.]|nr:cell division protein ZapA [Ruminiclostridium sp.]